MTSLCSVKVSLKKKITFNMILITFNAKIIKASRESLLIITKRVFEILQVQNLKSTFLVSLNKKTVFQKRFAKKLLTLNYCNCGNFM